ncbi:MAG: hypothetical protein CVU69_02360 [Deltaproteobacteria bacterium HGW-Deltaproteobacteria-4]|nr:MAG: hypothetical protein CVU69_02360 [Deltaproteobacteria bacterium HGW-Deltaproteobacteria-4]
MIVGIKRQRWLICRVVRKRERGNNATTKESKAQKAKSQFSGEMVKANPNTTIRGREKILNGFFLYIIEHMT